MKFQTAIAPLAAALTASACLLPEEIDGEREFQATGSRPSRSRWFPSHSKRQTNSFPIGSGDRFKDGTVAPVGIATDPEAKKDSIMGVNEVDSAVRGLASAYPEQVELFKPPFETHEGAELSGMVIGGTDSPKAFLMSGIHARERGGPDHTIYFIADLLAAHANGTGLTYGKQKYTSEQVKAAYEAGAVVLPLTNPDGVAYDQKTGSCWRKNRFPDAETGEVGVDLNRNFDFVWDYKTAFNPDADIGSAASDDPGSEIYHGTKAHSEPEVESIVWVLDQYNASLSWFLDLHSFAGDVLYAWGDDNVGTEILKQNFANKEYDGVRGFTGIDPPDSQYKEFMTSEDLSLELMTSETMAQSMNTAGDVKYTAMQSVSLYPTSGGSNDYVLGRYYGKQCNAGKVFGLCLEFGEASTADSSCPFYPNEQEYHNSMAQVGAGLMELMLAAAKQPKTAKHVFCKP